MKATGLFSAVLLIIVTSGLAISDPIELESGKVSGKASAGGDVHVYKGIPYARPPIGELRWRPPQPPEKWTDVKECSDFGPRCVQTPFEEDSFCNTREWVDHTRQSEDCLYLNVWTPARSGNDSFPVMLWIHGGGMRTGSASQPSYDSAKMAK